MNTDKLLYQNDIQVLMEISPDNVSFFHLCLEYCALISSGTCGMFYSVGLSYIFIFMILFPSISDKRAIRIKQKRIVSNTLIHYFNKKGGTVNISLVINC